MDTNHPKSTCLTNSKYQTQSEDGLVPKLISHCQVEEEAKIYEDASEDGSEEEIVAAI